MYTTISILLIIICVLLILIVLVQNSKGGGLASSFAASNQIMGVRKTTDFLEKATWTLAGAVFALCVIASLLVPRGEEESSSALDGRSGQIPVQTTPNFPIQGIGGETTPLPLEENTNE
ncbi:MAG: preprotein translocase subunit SecG [Odoribacteraceae bacterium]|jgi:preprotein translocase subunit SecG|nr:preprotein translocase subunit SecG [Odoribacteraceae bacterium]